MTQQEYIKELKAFLTEVDWDKFTTNRVNELTTKLISSVLDVRPIKYVYMNKYKIVTAKIAAKQEDLDRIALEVCAEYNITIQQLKVNSPDSCYFRNGKWRGKRHIPFVQARWCFCKTVLEQYSDTIYMMLAEYLGYKDHTSIMHLLYYRKNIVEVE